jgi:hypothetical protein
MSKRPRTNQFFGTLGLLLQGGTFVVFVVFFAVARLNLGGTNLPLPWSFTHYSVLLVLIGAVLGCLGLFFDIRRIPCYSAIGLLFPLLAVMGVLDGHF